MSSNEILSRNPSPDDLIPLSRPERLGLGVSRCVLGRRIAAGEFPAPIRINGRLYTTFAQLTEYKQRMLHGEGDGKPHHIEKLPRRADGRTQRPTTARAKAGVK